MKKLDFQTSQEEKTVPSSTTRNKKYSKTPRAPVSRDSDEKEDDIQGYTGDESDDETQQQPPRAISSDDEEEDIEILRRSRRIQKQQQGEQDNLKIAPGVKYYGVTFTPEDMESVADSRGWITDAVMETWFMYQKHEILGDPKDILLVKPTVAFIWMACKSAADLHDNLLPVSLHTRSCVMIPLTDARHWGLLCYVRATNQFYYYDSIAGQLLKHAKAIATRIYPYIQQEQPKQYQHVENGNAPEIHSQATPQQHNNYDCGVYVLAIVSHLCQCLASGNTTSTIVQPSSSSDSLNMSSLRSCLPHELDASDMRVPSNFNTSYIAKFRHTIHQFCIDRYITHPQTSTVDK